MTMTRAGFFKGLLAAVGIGQVANGVAIREPRSETCIVTNANKAGSESWGVCSGVPNETCPLGHVQEPLRYTFHQWVRPAAARIGGKSVELHVCAACGIVYVPPATKGKG